jgi:hypothetical protein
MPRLTDTSAEAERVLREAYRRMPFERRWRLMGILYHTARTLHAAGVRARNPATPQEIRTAWMQMTLGKVGIEDSAPATRADQTRTDVPLSRTRQASARRAAV